MMERAEQLQISSLKFGFIKALPLATAGHMMPVASRDFTIELKAERVRAVRTFASHLFKQKRTASFDSRRAR
jgi:hypothetical protein